MTDLEKEIKMLRERVSELEKTLNKVQSVVENIEKDIYLDDIEEDTINCPYCGTEFPIDYDENLKEIQCPECNNTIELDWSGDLEEGESCSGHCSSCGGCHNDEEE